MNFNGYYFHRALGGIVLARSFHEGISVVELRTGERSMRKNDKDEDYTPITLDQAFQIGLEKNESFLRQFSLQSPFINALKHESKLALYNLHNDDDIHPDLKISSFDLRGIYDHRYSAEQNVSLSYYARFERYDREEDGDVSYSNVYGCSAPFDLVTAVKLDKKKYNTWLKGLINANLNRLVASHKERIAKMQAVEAAFKV